jgi:hypothetical protein
VGGWALGKEGLTQGDAYYRFRSEGQKQIVNQEYSCRVKELVMKLMSE